jgi:hypothetical protein
LGFRGVGFNIAGSGVGVSAPVLRFFWLCVVSGGCFVLLWFYGFCFAWLSLFFLMLVSGSSLVALFCFL